jgi:hypothetical protein
MSNYVNVVTDDAVTVLNMENGESVKFFSDDYRYNKAIEFIREEDYESIFEMDTKHVVTTYLDTQEDQWGNVSIRVEDGQGIVRLNNFDDMEVPLENAITQRIIKMSQQGLSAQPLIEFISNLYNNPSKTAVAELYGFIEACELPITEDGCFIAYKIVKNDYMDIYSGKVSNKVGMSPAMPRHLVDDDCNRTCSSGLHFCSKAYLPHYGSGSGDRCMLVKVNPADVVAIPADYNNAKGRAWTYEVVGEVEGEWKTWLPKTDYTDRAVVSSKGKVKVEIDYDSYAYGRGYEKGYEDGSDEDGCYDNDGRTDNYRAGYNEGFDNGRDEQDGQSW